MAILRHLGLHGKYVQVTLFLSHCQDILLQPVKLIAGSGDTWQPQIRPEYWDTDIYNVGLSFGQLLRGKEITIQYNPLDKPEKYINLTVLLECLKGDLDMAMLPSEKKGAILQAIYITSGCKATFLKAFFQHSQFITGSEMAGCLSETDSESGFLAFIRLMGSLYLKKYLSAFLTAHNCNTLEQFFRMISSVQNTARENHEEWIRRIQEIVSDRVLSEEERLPSTTALHRHWLRTCWIREFWHNAIQQDVMTGLPLPEESGWKFKEESESYSFDWDCAELQEKVRGTVEFLTKGCTCKKSQCKSNQCKCRREKRERGPGCKSRECSNCRSDSAETIAVLDVESGGSSTDDNYSWDDSTDEEMEFELIQMEIDSHSELLI